MSESKGYTKEERKTAYNAVKAVVLGWGKHKGKTFKEVLKTDQLYLQFLTQDAHYKQYLGKNLNNLETLFGLPRTKLEKPKKEPLTKIEFSDLSDDE